MRVGGAYKEGVFVQVWRRSAGVWQACSVSIIFYKYGCSCEEVESFYRCVEACGVV